MRTPARPSDPRPNYHLLNLESSEACRQHLEFDLAYRQRRDSYRQLMREKCQGAIDDERPIHPRFLEPKNQTKDVNP